MRFRGLDLNLLAIFATLMEERNVSRTALRLHLSQPTISGALARLRDYFGDPLLVPQGRRMLPTALAETLGPQVAALLRSAGAILDNATSFDPLTSQRRFRIAASDYVSNVVLKPLTQRLTVAAPAVSLMIEPPGERSAARLEEGRIDLLVTPEEFASSRHPATTLMEERHVLVGWRDNPALAGPVTEEDFERLEHVTVMLGTDLPAAFAERQLEQLGRSRRVGLTVPHFSAVPAMVCDTMRVGLMHERLARTMQVYMPIVIRQLPFDFPMMREVVQHHRARIDDVSLRWFLQTLLDCVDPTS